MVSVIIPTYNRASLLPRAIESVLGQTFQEFELLVVDDGSTDNTEKVMEAYSKKDARVRYIKQSNSGGPARPKNTGIQRAKGEFIAILDSDDEWMPEKLEFQIKVFSQSNNPKLSVVGCDFLVTENANKKESRYRVPRYGNTLRALLMRDYMGPGSCMLYKRELFDAIGLFDERLRSGQDREMRIRIAESYDIEFSDAYLVRYYVGHDNISTALNLELREKDWEYIFKKYKQYYIQDHKLWSEKLRYDGTRYVLLGKLQKGQRRFLESLAKYPFNVKSFASLFISLFGKKAYEAVSKYKMLIGNTLSQ